jgi:hypothetical protein
MSSSAGGDAGSALASAFGAFDSRLFFFFFDSLGSSNFARASLAASGLILVVGSSPASVSGATEGAGGALSKPPVRSGGGAASAFAGSAFSAGGGLGAGAAFSTVLAGGSSFGRLSMPDLARSRPS